MGLLRTLSTGAPPSWVGQGSRVYGLNGIDRPWVWDTLGAIRNWGMTAPPNTTLGGVVGGAYTGTVYYYVTWYNSAIDEYSDLGNLLGPVTLTAQKQTINRPSVAGIDPQVTHWRVWRTTSGEGTAFYKIADVSTLTASYDDEALDAVVGSNLAMDSDADGSIIRHAPPSGVFRWVEEFKGRIFGYGSRVESTGTVSNPGASPNVTGVGTQFTQAMVGQKFYFAGDTTVYTVLSVTDATHLVLTANKVGAVAGVVYSITATSPSNMGWSNAGSESFDPANAFSVFPNDGDFPTGMKKVGGSLIFWKRAHAYAYDFGNDPDPGAAAVVQLALEGRGIVRNECCVVRGPVAYCLDQHGVYTFDGSATANEIDQGIRRMFHPDDGTPAEERINRAYSSTWHATFDPKTNCVMWFVTTGSDTFPQTALCWNIERERWTVNRYPMPIMASCLAIDDQGEFRAWVSDNRAEGPYAHSGTRGLDGTTHGTIAGTATAGGASTLTDGGAAFWTTGSKLKGVPVTIIGGTGAGQTRIIDANTASVLTTATAWATQPDATSVYRIGAMETRTRFPWYTFDAGSRNAAQTCRVYFEPTATPRTIGVRFYKDFETSPITAWDLRPNVDGWEIPAQTLADGYINVQSDFAGGRVSIEMPSNARRAFSVEVRQLDANAPVMVLGFDLEGFAAAQTRDK